jgi:capsular exopolysaccharide synthesis family protein
LAIRDDKNSESPGSSELPFESGSFAGFHDEDPFRVIVRFLRRRGWIVLLALISGYIVGILINHFSARAYTARASIEIQAQDISSQFRLEQMQGGDVDTSERLDTEIEILRSRDLALETIKALHLEKNTDFAPPKNGRANDLSSPDVREYLVAYFHAAVNVSRLGHTDIIEIRVTSGNPQLASVIANALIDRYIEHSFRQNYASTAKISDWLDERLNGLKANLEKSQEHILELQKQIGVFGIDQSHSVVTANLEELNKQYADAEVDRLLKEARLQEIKTASPDVIDAALGNNDPTLVGEKQRLSQMDNEYTSLSQTYGLAYPRVKALKAQMDQLQSALRKEEDAQIARAQKEYEAAAANESKLLAALNKQEEDAYAKGEKAVQYELARSEYEANRLLYNGLQQRLQEASIMSGLHSTAIHSVDSADVPVSPSHPRTRFNVAAAMGGAFVLGCALALLLEAMDTNLKTMTEIETALQLPLLAAIPVVDHDDLLPSKFKEHAMSPGAAAWSRMAEALRGMRTSILLSSPGSPPKVIMIASTRPAEGKSSVAALTAITFALNGSRVLLIDSDLRRPALHLRFRVGKGLGLSSVLSGKSTLKETVVEWPDLPNVHVLTSGPVPPLPSELLSSKQMEELLTQARVDYDFVILDTPPVLVVTDATVLGRMADATILIIRYGSAHRQVVQRCLDLLERSGSHLLGVAVNAVDFASPEYSEYYGRKYYEYYADHSG